MLDNDLVLPFRNAGREYGFLACKDREFIFKPNKLTSVTIPLEILKKNLRLLLKTKRARLLKEGTLEAVLVPKEEFTKLFI